MNTVHRLTVLCAVVATTSLVGVGTASAAPPPEPTPAQVAVTSGDAHSNSTAEDRARERLAHQLYVDRGQHELAEENEAVARSRAAQRHPGVGLDAVVTSGHQTTTPAAREQSSGNDLDVPLLAVTALAGLALGAAGSTASRRLRGFDSGRVGQGLS